MFKNDDESTTIWLGNCKQHYVENSIYNDLDSDLETGKPFMMDSFTHENTLKFIDDRWDVISKELKTKNEHLEKEAIEDLARDQLGKEYNSEVVDDILY